MAIRILVNGKYTTITCSCGCKYSFDTTDIQSGNIVPCPECGKENTATTK